MIRQPQRAKATAKQRIDNVVSTPAPIGGLNARDSLAQMKPTEAITLENWYPQLSYCERRGGSSVFATVSLGSILSMAVYNAENGSNKLIAFTGGGTFDVTSGGSLAPNALIRSNGYHQSVMFGDGANHWLIAVNGSDKPAYFNGTTWTAVDGATSPSLTGLTTSTLVNVAVHKNRLFFAANNQLAFYYLPANAAGGALTKFDLSAIAYKGGYLMAMSTWTVDSGTGPDDRIVFITSEGQILVYQGTDPSSAAAWSLVGVYEVGKPIGRKCFTKHGTDVLVLTQEGVFSLISVIQQGGVSNQIAISSKIERLFNTDAQTLKNNRGWKGLIFPTKSALIFNVPISEGSSSRQWVMNTISKAWCSFTGWDCDDMIEFNSELYYCHGTNVYKAWVGTQDVGRDIVAKGKPAFNYFGNSALQKKFSLFRPVIATSSSVTMRTAINVDFTDQSVATADLTYTPTGSLWDVGLWDSAYWTDTLEVVREWTAPPSWNGFAASGILQVQSGGGTIQWISSDFLIESGDVL